MNPYSTTEADSEMRIFRSCWYIPIRISHEWCEQGSLYLKPARPVWSLLETFSRPIQIFCCCFGDGVRKILRSVKLTSLGQTRRWIWVERALQESQERIQINSFTANPHELLTSFPSHLVDYYTEYVFTGDVYLLYDEWSKGNLYVHYGWLWKVLPFP